MLWVKRSALTVAVTAVHVPASAHSGHEHGAAIGWTLDPLIIAPLVLALALFLVGARRLGARSQVRRSRQTQLFLLGWLVLTLALLSPLHEGGEQSFTLHMVEHELIMLVATLLLAAANAGGTLAWGLPATIRRSLGRQWIAPFAWLWRRMTEPVTASLVQAVALWVWHSPTLFDRALESPAWHAAQHLSFLIASLAFWRAMLSQRGNGDLVAALCLFMTSLVEGALGALMALSQSPWYARYAEMGLSGIGLDPTTDQQLAGLLMWIPGGLVHGLTALYLLYRWLGRSERSNAFVSR